MLLDHQRDAAKPPNMLGLISKTSREPRATSQLPRAGGGAKTP